MTRKKFYVHTTGILYWSTEHSLGTFVVGSPAGLRRGSALRFSLT